MLAFVFTALHPGLKGGLEACRRGDTKISKEQAELLRFLPADARGIKNTEDPDRGEESPLHIEDRARCTAGCVLEGVGLEPPREVGHVPYRQEIAKGREDVVSSEEGLVSRRAWEARRSGVEGSQQAGNVEERGRGLLTHTPPWTNVEEREGDCARGGYINLLKCHSGGAL